MTTDDINNTEGQNAERNPGRTGNLILKIRNVLNIIFMLGCVIGMIFYFKNDRDTGLYIIMVAVPFKIAESAIRLFKI